MSDQFNSDEQVLARLVREAGDPSVSPDPQYAEALRATILDRVGSVVADVRVSEGIRKADVIPISVERSRQMKRIAKLAVAAIVFVAFGILVVWTTIGGGSTNIAFAAVAKALDNLRSATYDIKSEAKGDNGQPATATGTGTGLFLAPSHQRMELSTEILVNSVKTTINQVTIIDGQAAKWVMLSPDQKIAVAMDMKIIEDIIKKSGNGARPDLFEMVRRLVREGSSGTGEKAERLGKKEVDGRAAVGFRVHANMMDMTLWADPETAWPIRIEVIMEMLADVRLVMNNFRYNVDLDPSLFSLEPPEGYSTVAMNATMPVEEDLLSTLRMIAEQNKGLFPAKLEMPKTITQPTMALDKPTQEKLEAEMDKVAAKYGGKDKLREKYGKEIPPAIMAEIMKAGMPIMQKQMQEQWQRTMPLGFKQWNGMNFYVNLRPENDPHYVGDRVKLGTPDRPIFWYKPTGAEKYRVIYADLSVKELAPDDVKKLPEAGAK
jgi:outer membrane lipoprotein-sorting protein